MSLKNIAQALYDSEDVTAENLLELSAAAEIPGMSPEEVRQLRLEAAELCRCVVEIQPDNYEILYHWGLQLGILAKLAGTPDEARRLHREAIELNRRVVGIEPDMDLALHNWAVELGGLARLADTADEARRLHREALEMYRRAVDVEPARYDSLYGWATELLWLAHYDEEAASQLRDEALGVLGRRAEIMGQPVEHSYNYACVRAMQQRKAEALASLEQAMKAGEVSAAHVRNDPDWQHWRGDEELETLLARFAER